MIKKNCKHLKSPNYCAIYGLTMDCESCKIGLTRIDDNRLFAAEEIRMAMERMGMQSFVRNEFMATLSKVQREGE